MTAPRAEETRTSNSIDQLVGRGITVVVLEDELTSLRLSRKLLMELGFEVRSAADVDEVLLQAAGHLVDFFILDVNMGTSDRSQEGFDALEILKGKHPTVFVAIYTTKPGNEATARRLGCDFFRVKSANHPKDILSVARAYLESRAKEVQRLQEEIERRLERYVTGETAQVSSMGEAAASEKAGVIAQREGGNVSTFKRLAADPEWRRTNEGLIAAFVDGEFARGFVTQEEALAYLHQIGADHDRMIVSLRMQDEDLDIPSIVDLDQRER